MNSFCYKAQLLAHFLWWNNEFDDAALAEIIGVVEIGVRRGGSRSFGARKNLLDQAYEKVKPLVIGLATKARDQLVRWGADDINGIIANGKLSQPVKEHQRHLIEQAACSGNSVIATEVKGKHGSLITLLVSVFGEGATSRSKTRLALHAEGLATPPLPHDGDVLLRMADAVAAPQPQGTGYLSTWTMGDWSFLALTGGHLVSPLMVIESTWLRTTFIGCYLFYLGLRARLHAGEPALQHEKEMLLERIGSLMLCAIIYLICVEAWHHWVQKPGDAASLITFLVISLVTALAIEWLFPLVFGKKR